MDIFSFIMLLGGLTFFLFGMNVMSGSLEKMAGGKLERLLKKMTSNPLISISLGAAITIAVQSSSATSVMLVGLVNSGIMKFSQTINVLFGANIGTTLTSWILSLSGIESDNVWIKMLKPENFSPIVAFIGILLTMFSKKEKKKSIGTVFVGFAILMYGMTMMSSAVAPLGEMPEFANMLVKFNNPLLGLFIGTFFTAIIQSSAASIGILQALSLTGNITFNMAIPIVMGQNIGTCMTAVLSSIGTNKKAKRVVVLHITIKVIGMLICLPLYIILNHFIKFGFAAKTVSPVSIAVIHSVFNILTVIFLMPFSDKLVGLIEKIVKDSSKEKHHREPFLDERLLLSPSVAVVECNSATKRMADLAKENINLAISMFSEFDEKTAEKIEQTEEKLDTYEDKLGTYLVRLSAQSMSDGDSQVVSKMLHAIGDFERLGDHALNLLKTAVEINNKDISFTDDAKSELLVLTKAIKEILETTTKAYKTNDVKTASEVEPLEQVIDSLISEIKSNHINRLQSGNCTIEMGFILSDMLTNYERISDHCSNIAVAVIEVQNNSFYTHKYLNALKHGENDSEFSSTYRKFSEKYKLS